MQIALVLDASQSAESVVRNRFLKVRSEQKNKKIKYFIHFLIKEYAPSGIFNISLHVPQWHKVFNLFDYDIAFFNFNNLKQGLWMNYEMQSS